MDTLFDRISGSMEGFNFGHGSTSLSSNPNLANGFKVNHESTNTLFHPSDSSTSLSPASEEETLDISYVKYPTLKYISDILLDEDPEDKNCRLQDCLALQAAEKSFYDVLDPRDPPSPNQPPLSAYQSFGYSDDDSTQIMYQSSLC
ncbi:hypothetical protein M0R45_017218 [Rubus argutus]|uniref:Uncharacterized protein n=1 Tax=Rubus argutus TaxID=59490 RepID=A0AAW1XVH7_RUBAR